MTPKQLLLINLAALAFLIAAIGTGNAWWLLPFLAAFTAGGPA